MLRERTAPIPVEKTNVRRARRIRFKTDVAITYLLLVFLALIVLVPLMWAIAASFTPNELVFAHVSPFSWRALFPVEFTPEAYETLFARDFGRSIQNSMILGLSSVIVGGTICAMAGFAFARFEFAGKNVIFVLAVLLPFMIPVDLTVIPRYIIVRDLGWINKWEGLIIPNLVNSVVIFLFRQFFSEIPQDLIDAARVDGAGWGRVFAQIILPISKPVLISGALLLFLTQWDQFFWPLLVATRPDMRVVQVEIAQAVGQYQTQWNELMAGSVLAALVPVLLMLPFQRYYVQSLMGIGKS